MFKVRVISFDFFLGMPSHNLRGIFALTNRSADPSKTILQHLYIIVLMLVQPDIGEQDDGYAQYLLEFAPEN
jgi:hypothetical protein